MASPHRRNKAVYMIQPLNFSLGSLQVCRCYQMWQHPTFQLMARILQSHLCNIKLLLHRQMFTSKEVRITEWYSKAILLMLLWVVWHQVRQRCCQRKNSNQKRLGWKLHTQATRQHWRKFSRIYSMVGLAKRASLFWTYPSGYLVTSRILVCHLFPCKPIPTDISGQGLIVDEVGLHSDRIRLWGEFNNAWLGIFQKQKDMLETGHRILPPQSLMSQEFINKMMKDLIRMCDGIESHGLVDYQYGVAEERIVMSMFFWLHTQCLNSANHYFQSRKKFLICRNLLLLEALD